MKSYLCIYHGNCADGFTAAWVVRNALGDNNVEFYPGVYSEDPPWEKIKDQTLIFVDFTYKLHVMELILQQAKSVLILDHHKTAADNLLSLNHGRVTKYFDMSRSGARMAWDYFFPGQPVPEIIRFVEDRDLWKYQYPETRHFNSYLFSKNYSFENWDQLAVDASTDTSLHLAISAGKAIDEKHFKDIAELLAVCRYEMVIGGVKVPVANLPYTMASDAANFLANNHESKIGACYYETGKYRVFSLRSTSDGPDVAAIAASYGGGGHSNASGFRMPKNWEGDS